MMNFVNLTPHTVNLCDKEGGIIVSFPMPPKGALLPRLISTPTYKIVEGIPIGIEKYGRIENLPEPQEETVYIVSFLVNAQARKQGRTDTVFPAGQMFRDDSGRIIGMEFLATTF